MVRQYKTLGAQFNKNLYTMGTNVSNSDYVLIYQAGVWVTYYLLNVSGTPTWVTAATAPADQGGFCLDPSQGMFVHRRAGGPLSQTQVGHVRETKFACPLPVAGQCVLMSNPYPVAATVVDRGLINPTTASLIPFTGATATSLSDQIDIWAGDATLNAAYYGVHFYLKTTTPARNYYTKSGDSALLDENGDFLFQPLRSQMLCPKAAHSDYVIPLPWIP